MVFLSADLVRSLSGCLSSSVMVRAKRFTARLWTPRFLSSGTLELGCSSSSKSFVLSRFSSSASGHISSQIPTTGSSPKTSLARCPLFSHWDCRALFTWSFCFLFSCLMNEDVSPLKRPPLPNRSFLRLFLRSSSFDSSLQLVVVTCCRCGGLKDWLAFARFFLLSVWRWEFTFFCLFLESSRPSARSFFSSSSARAFTCLAHFCSSRHLCCMISGNAKLETSWNSFALAAIVSRHCSCTKSPHWIPPNCWAHLPATASGVYTRICISPDGPSSSETTSCHRLGGSMGGRPTLYLWAFSTVRFCLQGANALPHIGQVTTVLLSVKFGTA
mmetsp:Transcript_9459/g.28765  ORF Transcript_9459/g.28765 Transcript_9459/m.28765 type:complete len:329 (-) Transcript_9459:481-1467(-)